MKRMLNLIMILGIVILASCTETYKERDYMKANGGASIQIDSTKYRTVLMYEEGERIYIAEKGGVKEIYISNMGDTLELFFWVCLCICFLLAIVLA
jgi:hypothetical protein